MYRSDCRGEERQAKCNIRLRSCRSLADNGRSLRWGALTKRIQRVRDSLLSTSRVSSFLSTFTSDHAVGLWVAFHLLVVIDNDSTSRSPLAGFNVNRLYQKGSKRLFLLGWDLSQIVFLEMNCLRQSHTRFGRIRYRFVAIEI